MSSLMVMVVITVAVVIAIIVGLGYTLYSADQHIEEYDDL